MLISTELSLLRGCEDNHKIFPDKFINKENVDIKERTGKCDNDEKGCGKQKKHRKFNVA